ncbi:deoxycytidylate deaminase [Pseudomonas sp. TH39(2020)]|uniref:anti-phage dCTP deaminase n=1 Tax=Pseudomonas sp. TH39(2020) TaxID=2796349 RepID=UPI001911A81A|nr:anti-phage dCTP deaminase [Pseudomonas sp. TH39(2020)]MBK5398182.1 deoxycytidylate deaminase [Pseudomonas sp. TH39(2020)]
MSTGNVKAFSKLGSASIVEPPEDEDLRAKIKSRKTNEIIIGVCGAVGCNLQDVVSELKNQFGTFSYEVHVVKVSTIIKTFFDTNDPPAAYFGKIDFIDSLPLSGRYEALQDLGNYIRNLLGDDALAVQAVKHISAERDISMNSSGDSLPPRAIYIVDQLKHPAEVELLRLVYRNAFFLIGVMSPQTARCEYLQTEGLNSVEALQLIERDRKENLNHGQQLEKTVYKADFFVKHSLTSSRNIAKPCKRFADLVHGENGITPSRDESGMYAAYSASLKSACLSRQVGASIADAGGNILSLGWNDVPAPGGGLYNSESEPDQRCVHHGSKCYNDDMKSKLAKDIVKILLNAQVENTRLQVVEAPDVKLIEAALPIENLSVDALPAKSGGASVFSAEQASDLVSSILKDTALGAILEYSRAIHAEMEAILSVARSGAANTYGAIMYTTTYPCHNCARHIIASGISRVVYIEPYEKSLAMKLHADAISNDENSSGKVLFENFEGVSPTRYSTLFSFNNRRKDDSGVALHFINKKDASPVSNEFLDSYLDVELKVVKRAVKDSKENLEY